MQRCYNKAKPPPNFHEQTVPQVAQQFDMLWCFRIRVFL